MDIQKTITNLPNAPGVYLFKDAQGTIMYIGKALSLRRRVSSYFTPRPHSSPKSAVMAKKIASIDHIQTPSEIEALLLEADLIKEHQPRYNVALRDDKTFPFLKLTVRERFPRILVTRKRIDDGSLYFGPYTDARLLREAAWVLKKIFRLRGCKRMPKNVCLEYHLGQCMGPCEELATEKEYRESVRELTLFLEGKGKRLIRMLTRNMRQASANRRYEQAAALRDKIAALGSLSQKKEAISGPLIESLDELTELKSMVSLPRLPRRIEAFDISNISGTNAVGSMVLFCDGAPRSAGYRRFKIRTVPTMDDFKMMGEVLRRRFTRLLREDSPLPDLVVIDGGKGHAGVARRVLKELRLDAIPVIGIAKRLEEIWLVDRNAPLRLGPRSKALKLIKRLRDEAHRFAQGYHLELRDRAMLASQLDEIPSLGPHRKRVLLQYFDSVRDIQKADLKTLQEVDGIGQKTAQTIRDFFTPRH
ncbi:MAG: excinuclease ABC subunit UvrC [Candidatus Omnitrophica bacterium]|nr:excinuclease ABC subunit UvrC [Candidatus Omnitrophota bacterium]